MPASDLSSDAKEQGHVSQKDRQDFRVHMVTSTKPCNSLVGTDRQAKKSVNSESIMFIFRQIANLSHLRQIRVFVYHIGDCFDRKPR